jgi:hypothetical protein
MKKTLLALFTLAMSSVAVAQTHSVLSENMVVGADNGYVFNFSGTAANNCGPNAFLDYTGAARFGWEMSPESGVITFADSTGVGIPDNYYSRLMFSSGDCALSTALEITDPLKVRFAVRSNEAFDFHMAVIGAGGAASTPVNKYGTAFDGNFTYIELEITEATKGGLAFAAGTFSDIVGISIGATWYEAVTNPKHLEFNWIEVGSAVGTHSVAANVNNPELDAFAINVYPTPSSDELNVDLSKLSADAELKLVSTSGQTVYTGNASNSLNKINVADFTSGIYALQITSDGKSTTKKVVIK